TCSQSLPRGATSAASRDAGSRLDEAGLVDVGVRVDLLNVVEVVQELQQLQELFRVLALDANEALGDHRELRTLPGEPAIPERVLNRVEVADFGVDDPGVVLGLEVLRAGFERGLQQRRL